MYVQLTVKIILGLATGLSSVSFSNATTYKCCLFDNTVLNESGINVPTLRRYNETTINNKTKDTISSNFSVEAKLCHPNEIQLTKILSLNRIQFSKNIRHDEVLQIGNRIYPSQSYCLSEYTNAVSEVFVKVQAKPFCNTNICIRKCCNLSEVYDLSTYGVSKLLCVHSETKWTPVIHPAYGTNLNDSFSSQEISLVPDHPRNWCFKRKFLWSTKSLGVDKKSYFRILDNGSVIKREGYLWKPMNADNICIDGAINFPEDSFSEDEEATVIIECDPEELIETDPPLILYGIALSISSIFLVATFIAYGLLWDKQNLHGWTLLGFVASMLLFYISIILTFIYEYNYPDPDFENEKEIFSSFCGIIAVVSHYLYIQTICWVTVISFDIFSKFRILKLTGARSKNKLKFFIYLIFTIITPSVIVSTGVILDIAYGDEFQVDLILPRYGWRKCFLDLNNAAIPYLFGPIGFLLTFNCILYATTIYHMYNLHESTKFASSSSSQVQRQRDKVKLFSKLFLLMGLIWMYEFISFLVFQTKPNIFVIIGDILTITQPIIIFIIFVCKRDILESLCAKYSTLARIFSASEAEEFTESSASSIRYPRRLTRIWNPITAPRWLRSRINSTTTDTSNISNQSLRSINLVETPTTPALPPVSEESISGVEKL